jgi:hypothetical protein
MKNHIGAFALLLPLALAGAGSALAAEESAATDAAAATCSEATLQGTYQYADAGFTVSGEGQGPRATAGQQVFDGRGQTHGVFTLSTNGEITRFIHVTGKYTVNPDCAGSASFSKGATGDLFIAPDGGQLVFVRTNPGSVRAGFGQRTMARRVDD